MFDEKLIEEYHNVKAPKELKDQILKSANNNQSSNIITLLPRYAAVIAACIIAVIVGGFTLNYFNSSVIVSLQGENSQLPGLASARETDAFREVLINIETNHEVRVSVSSGVITFADADNDEQSDKLTVKENKDLIWRVDATALETEELNISSLFKSTTYLLTEEDGELSLLIKK